MKALDMGFANAATASMVTTPSIVGKAGGATGAALTAAQHSTTDPNTNPILGGKRVGFMQPPESIAADIEAARSAQGGASDPEKTVESFRNIVSSGLISAERFETFSKENQQSLSAGFEGMRDKGFATL
jgi:hypothetical protein